MDITRDEVRRRNLIPADKLPYVTPVKTRDGLPMTYDSGDYPESQKRARSQLPVGAIFPRARKRRSAKAATSALGLCNYVEGTGRGPFESVTVRIGASGKIVVATGATDQGQGTHTMLAQFAAETFGVAPERVQVIAGDTAASALGHGSYASRQAVTAGSALHIAAGMVADKAKLVASSMLEVAADDLELADGEVRVRGVPEHEEVASARSRMRSAASPASRCRPA